MASVAGEVLHIGFWVGSWAADLSDMGAEEAVAMVTEAAAAATMVDRAVKSRGVAEMAWAEKVVQAGMSAVTEVDGQEAAVTAVG